VSTAKSLFIRCESDVWESLRSQQAALTEANERLAQWSAEVADLWSLCDELKSEAAAASARAEASSVREQVASQAEEMQQRQLELSQVIDEWDQSQSQAAEAVSRAEALRGSAG
jgi:predicted  nucleic acid-binding Zn-ribbon protein